MALPVNGVAFWWCCLPMAFYELELCCIFTVLAFEGCGPPELQNRPPLSALTLYDLDNGSVSPSKHCVSLTCLDSLPSRSIADYP